MKHLREFIYDKSDILVALVILLIAALLIFWRFEAIADYPSTLVDSDEVKSLGENSEMHNSKDETKKSEKKSTENSSDSESDNNSSEIYVDGATKDDANISVQSGSAIEATESLVSLGYFSSYNDFVSTCNSAGINPDLIKAGNFNIPAGSTKADIAKIVCQ